MDPGSAITEQTLRKNADAILEYLRDRGFFKAEVTYSQRALTTENESAVTFVVTPNEQATVDRFNVAMEGFNSAGLQNKLKLRPGAKFTRALLAASRNCCRDATWYVPYRL